ncbi:MAG TPA: coenzyme F420-0:L-glutamate ligase [Dehalococcoidia bacterium]|nr:coenzyme F420-0:L-glutamate ligase [Dehalococcoidia bacterium]
MVVQHQRPEQFVDAQAELRILPVAGIPEVHPGDDLPGLITKAAQDSGTGIQQLDVLVIAQKVVSKAEGCLVSLASVEPSVFARTWAEQWGKDPRHVEVVLREAARIVRMGPGILIAETKHGFVCANAGVDASNVAGEEMLCLLPPDPDASAARIVDGIRERLGAQVGVIISDTFGRAWRESHTNIAIGVAGMAPIRDYVGLSDPYGYELRVTTIADADELAGAAELVMGKIAKVPVAIVRGFQFTPAEGSARQLVRAPERDLFR